MRPCTRISDNFHFSHWLEFGFGSDSQPHNFAPRNLLFCSEKMVARQRNYNLGHNILELYNVLVQIRLTTSKTKRDIKYSKLGIRVAS